MVQELRSNIVSNKTPSHQMRKCLKLGLSYGLGKETLIIKDK